MTLSAATSNPGSPLLKPQTPPPAARRDSRTAAPSTLNVGAPYQEGAEEGEGIESVDRVGIEYSQEQRSDITSSDEELDIESLASIDSFNESKAPQEASEKDPLAETYEVLIRKRDVRDKYIITSLTQADHQLYLQRKQSKQLDDKSLAAQLELFNESLDVNSGKIDKFAKEVLDFINKVQANKPDFKCLVHEWQIRTLESWLKNKEKTSPVDQRRVKELQGALTFHNSCHALLASDSPKASEKVRKALDNFEETLIHHWAQVAVSSSKMPSLSQFIRAEIKTQLAQFSDEQLSRILQALSLKQLADLSVGAARGKQTSVDAVDKAIDDEATKRPLRTLQKLVDNQETLSESQVGRLQKAAQQLQVLAEHADVDKVKQYIEKFYDKLPSARSEYLLLATWKLNIETLRTLEQSLLALEKYKPVSDQVKQQITEQIIPCLRDKTITATGRFLDALADKAEAAIPLVNDLLTAYQTFDNKIASSVISHEDSFNDFFDHSIDKLNRNQRRSLATTLASPKIMQLENALFAAANALSESHPDKSKVLQSVLDCFQASRKKIKETNPVVYTLSNWIQRFVFALGKVTQLFKRSQPDTLASYARSIRKAFAVDITSSNPESPVHLFEGKGNAPDEVFDEVQKHFSALNTRPTEEFKALGELGIDNQFVLDVKRDLANITLNGKPLVTTDEMNRYSAEEHKAKKVYLAASRLLDFCRSKEELLALSYTLSQSACISELVLIEGKAITIPGMELQCPADNACKRLIKFSVDRDSDKNIRIKLVFKREEIRQALVGGRADPSVQLEEESYTQHSLELKLDLHAEPKRTLTGPIRYEYALIPEASAI